MGTVSVTATPEVVEAVRTGAPFIDVPIEGIELQEEGALLSTQRTVRWIDVLSVHRRGSFSGPTIRVYMGPTEED